MAIQLELLLLESVNLVRSVVEGDLAEAQFRARRVGDLAWTVNESKVGNAAIELEIALRDAARIPRDAHEDKLAYLLAELERVLASLRG